MYKYKQITDIFALILFMLTDFQEMLIKNMIGYDALTDLVIGLPIHVAVYVRNISQRILLKSATLNWED